MKSLIALVEVVIAYTLEGCYGQSPQRCRIVGKQPHVVPYYVSKRHGDHLVILDKGGCGSLQVLHSPAAPQLHVLFVFDLGVGDGNVVEHTVLGIAWLENEVMTAFILDQLPHTDIKPAG